MRWIGALLLFASHPAFAQEATLFVENATAAEDLIAILKEELPPQAFAETAEFADLRARLSEELALSIVDRSGVTLVDRALEGGRDAAVRVAALLIVEARESWTPARVDRPLRAENVVSATIAEPETDWYFGASAGVGLGMLSWTSKAQLLFAGSAYFGIAGFELGVGLSIGGRGCACAVRTETLRVEPEPIALVAEGRWLFWRPLPQFEPSVWLAGGYQWERVESRVIGGFAANGPLETITIGGPIARAGLGLGSRWFEVLRIRIDLGVQVQSQAAVTLPPFMEYLGLPGSEVRRGRVVPLGALSIGVEI